jgi:hypothetical protein
MGGCLVFRWGPLPHVGERLQSANPRLPPPISNSSPSSARRWIAAGLDNSPSCQARHSSTRLRNSLWQRMPTRMPTGFVRGRSRFRLAFCLVAIINARCSPLKDADLIGGRARDPARHLIRGMQGPPRSNLGHAVENRPMSPKLKVTQPQPTSARLRCLSIVRRSTCVDATDRQVGTISLRIVNVAPFAAGMNIATCFFAFVQKIVRALSHEMWNRCDGQGRGMRVGR